MTTGSIERVRNIATQLLPVEGGISEAEIASAVDRAVALIPIPEQDREQLIRDLQAAYTVTVGEARALDGGGDHVEWLFDRQPEIDWKLWLRYMRYLTEKKELPPPVVNRLDDDTDQILRRLEDPKRAGGWDRRGMVVGHVQSGKTANYTGLICKAADAGYKVIVVLAGLDDSLRSQTQRRIDEGFLGFDTEKRRKFDQANSRLGVGLLPGAVLYPVHSLTSVEQKGDFQKRAAGNIGVNPGGSDPLILVVKKNKSILNNLISWITSFDAQHVEGRKRPIVRNVPLLVLDDECDHASVNTKVDDPNEDPTAINRCIRNLLASFDQSAYVGYTATPFANIFIAPESGAEDAHGEDLFPRDFIISLKKPSNYLGAARVFGLEGDTTTGLEGVDALPITRTVADSEEWVPSVHKNGHPVPDPMPDSLRKALLSFVIVCAARRARGQENEHNSMLIHVTRFNNVQKMVAEQVDRELGFIKNRIKYGDGGRRPSLLDELLHLWESDFKETTQAFGSSDLPYIEWDEVAPHLYAAVSKINVRIVNGLAKESLEYADSPGGVSVIAIGGAKLSRGLTLEGLSVSYYLRTSRMYDTLLQMGRWFGFRSGYMDLCRLYTTAELQRWYKDIALANEDLLLQFEEMALTGGTPRDFGLRVRQSADGLVVTAAGKMRSGTKMKLTFSRSVSETIIFDTNRATVESNFNCVADFVRRMDAESDPRPRTQSRDSGPSSLVWTGIAGDAVADFLDEFITHRQATKAQSKVMAQYIRGRLRATEPELTSWTVCLLSNPGPVLDLAGHPVGRTGRARFPNNPPFEPGLYGIRRLLSPADEWLDLTPDELAEAKRLTLEMWEKGFVKSKSGEPPVGPNGLAVREARPAARGLVLLYALDERAALPAELTVPFMGLGVSFPASKDPAAGSIEYVVNSVYSQVELELE